MLVISELAMEDLSQQSNLLKHKFKCKLINLAISKPLYLVKFNFTVNDKHKII